MAIRAATKKRQGLMSRVLPHYKISLLPMGSSGRLRRLGHGLAMTHTRELYKNAEYRNMIRARRDQNAEFDADTTIKMTDDTVKSEKPYQERYRARPLCQDPTHGILEADKWQAGSREHMHLTCRDKKLMRTQQERDMMVETASRNLCETLAKVQEEHQYRYQIQKLMDQRQQVESESAEAMSTQCKKIKNGTRRRELTWKSGCRRR